MNPAPSGLLTELPAGRSLRTLLYGAHSFPGHAAMATMAGILNGATMVLAANAIGYATDTLVTPAIAGEPVPASVWVRCALAICGVSLVRWATIVLRGVSGAQVQYRSEAETRRAVAHRYLDLDLDWHREHSPGRLLAHVVSDAEAMWSPMQWAYFAIGNVSLLVFALIQLLGRDPQLGILCGVLVAAVLAVNVTYQRLLRPRTRRVQEARGAVAALAHESVEGDDVVRSLGLAEEESRRFNGEVERLRQANNAMSRVSSLMDPVLELLPTVAVLAVLLVSAGPVQSGQLSLGDVVGVVYLMLIIALPLNVLSRFGSSLPIATAGGGRLADVLHAPSRESSGTSDLTGDRPLAVDACDISVVRGQTTILDRVTLKVPAGGVTVLAGQVGAGKSTLLEVVAALITPTSGTVRLDGIDLGHLRTHTVPRDVGFVPQTPFLFATSIRTNLLLRAPGTDTDSDASDADLWEALRIAVADDFVAALPHGLDTVVGARGGSLSGGQRQRLCLARALVRRPRLLLLDDPGAALDATVETQLLTNLHELTHRAAITVVMAANRPGAVALADQVVVLEAGRVLLSGHRAELSEQDEFRRIVTAYAAEAAR